jgi:hypothetical protein
MEVTPDGTAHRLAQSAWYPQNTVIVGVAQARDIEFEARYPGDWMLHCHLPHHMMNAMVSMVGPMAHWGHGSQTQTGKGMEEGMGMVRGHALSDENAPGFGRGMGMAAAERPTSAAVAQAPHGGHGTPATSPPGGPPAPGPGRRSRPRVSGFPQDMWMPMDEEVAKPETFGLPKDWSAALGGMMTLVRVLSPERYDEIMTLVREAGGSDTGARPAPQPAGSAVPAGGHRH